MTHAPRDISSCIWDWSRPHAWRWRHWVIEALTDGMPFNQFTTEQIAGDLLPNATVEQHVATGFHRNTLWSREGGVDPDQLRDDAVADRTNTVGMAWLGLTVGCARCHDHKYDPISQKERTPLVELRNSSEASNAGRDHHPNAFSMWMAGGGIQGGQVVGKTDELCMNIVEDKTHVNDLQAHHLEPPRSRAYAPHLPPHGTRLPPHRRRRRGRRETVGINRCVSWPNDWLWPC